jgi:hypothetical protein
MQDATFIAEILGLASTEEDDEEEEMPDEDFLDDDRSHVGRSIHH